MELEVLDEALTLPGRGIALMSMDEKTASKLRAGMTLVDARGNRHELTRVTESDGVWMLLITKGDTEYFGRLFRDVRVDATRFTVEQ